MTADERRSGAPADDAALSGGVEWRSADHVARYRAEIASLPSWGESERALSEHLPQRVDTFLDIGTGDGRLIQLVRDRHPGAAALGLDFSPPMLAAARERFAGDRSVELVEHDLRERLPRMEPVDLVVSAFAIHHLEDARKRSLYTEVFGLLRPGGLFLNMEHVASASDRLHAEFLGAIGVHPDDEDPSNRLVPAWTQAEWLRELGFVDADCHWKWRELALIGARRPEEGAAAD